MANFSGDQPKIIDGSAIVEMDIMDDDNSDYEVDFSADSKGSAEEKSQGGYKDDIKKKVTEGMASYMWDEGTTRAKKAFNVYANIDVLRPYFDVEPHEVRNRLMYSLIPKIPRAGSQKEKIPRELYGPTMLVFTMIALLLFQMKSSGHAVQEGTLMGSAFGVCFGYWLGVASLLWVLTYVCNTQITIVQILNLLGYALFGHCLVLFIGTVVHPSSGHMFFYLLWAVFGGLSTLRMVSVLTARTTGRSQKMIVCGTIAAIHLLFLLYLHFAYHQIVEELSAIVDMPAQPHPVAPKDNIAENQLEQNVKKINDALPAPPKLDERDENSDKLKLQNDPLQRVIREAGPAKPNLDNNIPKNGTVIASEVKKPLIEQTPKVELLPKASKTRKRLPGAVDMKLDTGLKPLNETKSM